MCNHTDLGTATVLVTELYMCYEVAIYVADVRACIIVLQVLSQF